MPVSMTQHAPRTPAEAYEQIIANVGQPLRGSDGFISDAAEITTLLEASRGSACRGVRASRHSARQR